MCCVWWLFAPAQVWVYPLATALPVRGPFPRGYAVTTWPISVAAEPVVVHTVREARRRALLQTLGPPGGVVPVAVVVMSVAAVVV